MSISKKICQTSKRMILTEYVPSVETLTVNEFILHQLLANQQLGWSKRIDKNTLVQEQWNFFCNICVAIKDLSAGFPKKWVVVNNKFHEQGPKRLHLGMFKDECIQNKESCWACNSRELWEAVSCHMRLWSWHQKVKLGVNCWVWLWFWPWRKSYFQEAIHLLWDDLKIQKGLH